MGLWKLAIALMVGAALTESGRKTIKDCTKRLITAGQSLKTKTTELIEEAKSEELNHFCILIS